MSELNVDTINEQTSANGVTIDGVLLKMVSRWRRCYLLVSTLGLVLISSTNAVQLQILHLIMYLLQLIRVTK